MNGNETSQLGALRFIWYAMVGAVLLYAFVCEAVLRGGIAPGISEDLARVLSIGLGLAALGTGAASFVIKRTMLPASRTPAQNAEARHQELPRLMTGCIVVWALSESVAVLGLALAILVGEVAAFVPFGAAALLLLFLHRPATWPFDRLGGPTGSVG